MLAEPKGNHSCDILWECSDIVFSCLKNLCYGLISLLCGFWLAAFWGIAFGWTAFQHIWICSPFARLVELIMDFFRCFRPIVRCCIVPYTAACAHLFILFAEPGVDIDQWSKPVFNTPVRKLKPPPQKDEKKSDGKQSVKVIPPVNSEDLYLGTKTGMAKSIQRQMGLV